MIFLVLGTCTHSQYTSIRALNLATLCRWNEYRAIIKALKSCVHSWYFKTIGGYMDKLVTGDSNRLTTHSHAEQANLRLGIIDEHVQKDKNPLEWRSKSIDESTSLLCHKTLIKVLQVWWNVQCSITTLLVWFASGWTRSTISTHSSNAIGLSSKTVMLSPIHMM